MLYIHRLSSVTFLFFPLSPFRIASCLLVLVAVGTLPWQKEPHWARASRTARIGTEIQTHNHTHRPHVKRRYFLKDKGRHVHIRSSSRVRSLFSFNECGAASSLRRNTNTLCGVCKWSSPSAVSVTESQTLAGSLRSAASWPGGPCSMPPGAGWALLGREITLAWEFKPNLP